MLGARGKDAQQIFRDRIVQEMNTRGRRTMSEQGLAHRG
jgi:hypothetical protein